jgi:hypothetical protein
VNPDATVESQQLEMLQAIDPNAASGRNQKGSGAARAARYVTAEPDGLRRAATKMRAPCAHPTV